MSYVELSGDLDEVSGVTIIRAMNAQGLACTGMNQSMEGVNTVMRFEFDEGEGASYRNAQTKPDLLLKFKDALERAGLYIAGRALRMNAKSKELSTTRRHYEIVFLVHPDANNFGEELQLQVSREEPPPSSPPRGSLAWAEQILAGS